MKHRWLAVTLAIALPALGAWAATTTGTPRFAASRRNYLVGCGGCHGVDGVSNSKLVPELQNQVGYYLNNTQGREYLVRVPNVAFYTASDRDLTDMLNYMVFELGGASVPAGAKPYTVAEVARLRKQPFTEISLVDYRKQLIDTLIARYQAPERMRIYGSDRYRNE